MKRVRHLLPSCLLAVATLVGCEAETGANHDSGEEFTSSDLHTLMNTREKHVSETSKESRVSDIRLSNGKLSVSLVEVPLHRLATEVSQQSTVDIQLIGEFHESSITAKMSDQPLEAALKILFRDSNTIFIYADDDGDGHNSGQLVRVLVLPDGVNNIFASGMGTTDDLFSKISEHLQASLPQAYETTDLDYPEIDPALDQVLFELGENLRNQ